MKQIKFRARTENGWKTGVPFKTNHEHHTPDLWYIISDFYDPNGYGGNNWFLINPKTISLFTGLHDKNGKEYFIGDIGKFDNGDTFVLKLEEWLEVYCDWIGEAECEDQTRDLYRISNAIIIGNLFENPELIK